MARESSMSVNERQHDANPVDGPISETVYLFRSRMSMLPPDLLPASHTTMVPSHFNAPPANMCTRAVQGCRRYARHPRGLKDPNNLAFTSGVLGKRFMGRNIFEGGP
jgi:hypothetical protein